MFEHIEPYAGDPILSLVTKFNQDSRDDKVNLSVGYYYDENGEVPQLNVVKTAIASMNEYRNRTSLYLPISGLADYCSAIKTLLLGENHDLIKQNKIATIQTIGGSGALKIGADFLFRYFPSSQIWVSNPTWENHIAIFEGAGFNVNRYPYYNSTTNGVDFNAMMESLKTLPAQSIVLIHPCCHNPTGADLSNNQWDEVLQLIQKQDLIPFVDIAYQGFGDDIEQDAYVIRKMAELNICGLIANSFSKTFSLYGERVGGLSVICHDSQTADNVLGQLQATVRRNYSSPPSYGAHIISHILNSPELKSEWTQEVKQMRNRIVEMRQSLFDVLQSEVPNQGFSYLTRQRGMFSYTGLTAQQVNQMREQYGIYLVGSGRICVAGLNHHNIESVAKAFALVCKS